MMELERQKHLEKLETDLQIHKERMDHEVRLKGIDPAQPDKLAALLEQLTQVLAMHAAPLEIVRDASGRAVGARRVTN
jgi:hypothetical protein